MSKTKLPVFSVSDLTALTNQVLENAFSRIVVEGEVANFRVSQNKYVHFDIKDEQASIGCFMSVFQLHIALRDGVKVRIAARPKLTPWGRFSLVVQAVELAGEGSIKQAYEQLRRRLEQEGLFDQNRKRVLPLYPKSVALITSIEAAGYRDFVKIAKERWGNATIYVANVQVQGLPAPEQIADAISYCNNLVPLPETIVVTRGGGR